jgi:hypothetical protein
MMHFVPLARVILLVCAAASFGGAGAASAIRRHRFTEYLVDDLGFMAVTAMLMIAAVLCAAMAGGIAAVLALMLPIGIASYALTAQNLGEFTILTRDEMPRFEAETELQK